MEYMGSEEFEPACSPLPPTQAGQHPALAARLNVSPDFGGSEGTHIELGLAEAGHVDKQ